MSTVARDVPVKVRKRVLEPARFKDAEYERHVWRIVPPEGDTFEEICRPEYFAHIAARMTVCDHIEVIPDDQAFYAELLVVAIERMAAAVQVLLYVPFRANDISDSAIPVNHRIEYKGPHAKFRIVRISDGAVIKDQLQNKAAALKALDDYLKAISFK